MDQKPQRSETLLGLAVLGSLLTGVLSILAAIIAFFNGDHMFAGIFMIAAGLTFGLLTNALSRR